MGMNKVDVTKLIEENYLFNYQPFVTRVMCKDDITHYGYFYSFKDFIELKENTRFRFIPRNNMHSFLHEYSKNNDANTDYSIILDGEMIIDIEFVLPLHI